MVGALPALFGKLFLIGYLIPAAAILLASAGVFDLHMESGFYAVAKSVVASTDEKVVAIRIGFFVVVVWVFAVLLMASNLAIIRSLEGYGDANPARLLKWRTVGLFIRLSRRRAEIDLERKTKGTLPPEVAIEERKVLAQLGTEFPEREDLVLPTRFGNVVRAFERYPQVVYGIDSIQAWGRLQALLGESYCTLLDDAKAQLDLLVNLWFGGVLIAALNVGLLVWSSRHLEPAVWASNPQAWIVLGVAIAAAVIAAKWAQSAAMQWGVLVKGAFDLYRGDLARQMGLEIPRSVEHERRMWTKVAQTMLYRLPHFADGLTQYRPLDPPRTKRDDAVK